MVEHEIEYEGEGDHLANIAEILNERDMNLDLNFNKQQKLTRNLGHRRYSNSNKKSQQQDENISPLDSSRFFLSRVASKNSSFEENSYR